MHFGVPIEKRGGGGAVDDGVVEFLRNYVLVQKLGYLTIDSFLDLRGRVTGKGGVGIWVL